MGQIETLKNAKKVTFLSNKVLINIIQKILHDSNAQNKDIFITGPGVYEVLR